MCRFNGFPGCKGEMMRPDLRHTRRSHEQKGHANVKASAHLHHAFIPDSVPRDIHGSRGRFRRGQDEPGNRTAIRTDRPMTCRRTGYPQPALLEQRQLQRFPVGETDRVIFQSLGTCRGRYDLPAFGRNLRPSRSRLSKWWSWLSRMTSTGSRELALTAGPIRLRKV